MGFLSRPEGSVALTEKDRAFVGRVAFGVATAAYWGLCLIRNYPGVSLHLRVGCAVALTIVYVGLAWVVPYRRRKRHGVD